MKSMIVAMILAAVSFSTLVAQSANSPDMPPDVMLLVQSELDYLDVADRKISIEFKKVAPEKALGQIGAKAGLAIEVHGILPEKPKLTESFEDATVKEVLIWYAGAVPVVYKADGPAKLTVIFRDEKPQHDNG